MNHLPSEVALRLPQLHSHDYYVRVQRAGLSGIVFEHLYTAPDTLVLDDAARELGWGCRNAGATEWHGRLGKAAVSISWDWAEFDDGEIRVFKAAAPRTNLRVVDSKGYDVVGAEAVAAFWGCIEALAWHPHVQAAVTANCACPRGQ
jgi:Domain of unknown function (DUF4902)